MCGRCDRRRRALPRPALLLGGAARPDLGAAVPIGTLISHRIHRSRHPGGHGPPVAHGTHAHAARRAECCGAVRGARGDRGRPAAARGAPPSAAPAAERFVNAPILGFVHERAGFVNEGGAACTPRSSRARDLRRCNLPTPWPNSTTASASRRSQSCQEGSDGPRRLGRPIRPRVAQPSATAARRPVRRRGRRLRLPRRRVVAACGEPSTAAAIRPADDQSQSPRRRRRSRPWTRRRRQRRRGR